jgi:Ca-activated chloride channel family protein
MLRFANPSAFILAWFIPLLIVMVVALEKRGQRRLVKTIGCKITPFLSASVSKTKRRLKLVLRCFSLALFVTALARPQLGASTQVVKAQGVELVIAIDVSNSMLTEDVKPSRLEHAKAEVSKLLDMLSGDRVGLVAFAGSAVLLSPLSSDIGSLKMFVEGLSTESVNTQGTSFQAALDEAKGAFERGGIEGDENLKVTRVILLISDGEDQEKGAVELAQKLAIDGTRIFSIAFGTERGGPIPMRDERGFLSGFKRDKSGQNVISQVHGDFLRELAKIGKGAFHHATFGGMEAREVKADLDHLEKAEFASSMSTNYDERFQFPLFLGLLCAFVEFILGERRGVGRLWRGRFEVAEQ